MNLLIDRAKRREELVRLAKDSNVSKLAELFLAKYRTDLEHLYDGDHVEDHVPVGKEKFTEWLKETISQYFPNLSGLIENERSLKDYAGQVGDAVAKSDTGVQNPLKDYKISKDPVFVKAQFTPAKPTVPAPYQAPVEHFYHSEDHQSSIIEKGYETGVKNQNLMNKMHPIKPFLGKGKGQDLMIEDKQEATYDVFKDNEALISPSAPNDEKATSSKKEASDDSLASFKLTRKAFQLFGPTTMVARQCPDHPGQQLSRVADNVRQCPLDGKVYDYTRGFTTEDGKKFNGGSVQAQHSIPPGSIIVKLNKEASASSEEAETRISAPDMEAGTYSGEPLDAHHHNRLGNEYKHLAEKALKAHDKELAKKYYTQAKDHYAKADEMGYTPLIAGLTKTIKTASDTPKTHAFLYQILQYLPGDSRERQILNYKFQHNLSLEEAIVKFEEAETLAAQRQAQPAGKPSADKS